MASFFHTCICLYHPVIATVRCMAVDCPPLDSFHCEFLDIKLYVLPCYFFLINRFCSGGSLDWDWASGTRAWLPEWANHTKWADQIPWLRVSQELTYISGAGTVWPGGRKNKGAYSVSQPHWHEHSMCEKTAIFTAPLNAFRHYNISTKSPNSYRTTQPCHPHASGY